MTNAISSDGIAATLKHFDELPDSAHVDTDVVAAIFGCSISTVRRRVKAGELPAPQKVGQPPRSIRNNPTPDGIRQSGGQGAATPKPPNHNPSYKGAGP